MRTGQRFSKERVLPPTRIVSRSPEGENCVWLQLVFAQIVSGIAVGKSGRVDGEELHSFGPVLRPLPLSMVGSGAAALAKRAVSA